jgi:hypothetical protein
MNYNRRWSSFILHPSPFVLCLWLLCPAAGQAQTTPDWAGKGLWPSPSDPAPSDASQPSRARPPRIQLFRITPAFLTDPVGLDADDPTPSSADNLDWLQVSLGNDNPFFDFRRPGDPGGVGYYKMHSQVQLYATQTTYCTIGLQAVTPAGLDQDGVADGPTVVIPSVCLYHELEDGTAFQGFLGKNMLLNAALGRPLHYNMQCGFAVQRPLLDTGPDKVGSFYLFLETLGRYRYDATATNVNPNARAAVWEMIPGVHWRMTDNVWLSGGMLMPVGALTSQNSRLWQFTCSIQF